MERNRPAVLTMPILSGRSPPVAAATVVLWAAAFLAARDAVEVVLGLVLVTALVPIVLIDLEHRRIPNAITLPAATLALVAGTSLDPAGEPARIAAAAGSAAFLLVPALVRPDGMGIGDVKLAGLLGLCLGPAAAVALLVALLAGTAFGLLVALRSGLREARSTAIAFGPYLALGGLVALAVGSQLVDAYLRAFWGTPAHA